MEILDWLNGFEFNQLRDLMINGYPYKDFLLGSGETGRIRERRYHHIPMPIHFVIKHRNQGKIESHKWFFKGFCEYLNPVYTQIIDCGSIPMWNSISRIVKHMDTFESVGGATGEIEVILSSKDRDTNQEYTIPQSILLRAQYFEYKMSTYADKAIESTFGFVSVLPGAFSTFRWECINGDPLREFLKGSKDEFSMDVKMQP